MSIILTPGKVTLATLESIYRGSGPVTLDAAFRPAIAAAAARIAEIAGGDEAVYGVNTGFGKLASVRIAAGDVATLQRNLILSHCCGVGEPLPDPIVRLIMATKLISLGRGASGVRPQIVELIEAMLAHGILPVIPGQGSVGASGDLAPLAHMAAAMIGEGRVRVAGVDMAAGDALRSALRSRLRSSSSSLTTVGWWVSRRCPRSRARAHDSRTGVGGVPKRSSTSPATKLRSAHPSNAHKTLTSASPKAA